MEFAELVVEDFDEQADLQIKMWNQFMRKKSTHEDPSLLDGVSISFLFLTI